MGDFDARRNFIRCKTRPAGSASRISGTRGLKGSPTGCGRQWDGQPGCRKAFGSAASWIKTEPRIFNFRYCSDEHFVEVFKTYYGPLLKAFSALDLLQRTGLEKDLYDLIARMNKADDGTMVVPSEYLEVVLVKG